MTEINHVNANVEKYQKTSMYLCCDLTLTLQEAKMFPARIQDLDKKQLCVIFKLARSSLKFITAKITFFCI